MNLNPSKPATNPHKPTKEAYRAKALEEYQQNVSAYSNVVATTFPIQSLAEQIFSAMSGPGKQYLYMDPQSLEFVVSKTVISGNLYICTFNPGIDLTPWLVTNTIKRLGITKFMANGVLYVVK